jgi:hypothetical protein
MIIAKEKQTVLDEMARGCRNPDGYGIAIDARLE